MSHHQITESVTQERLQLDQFNSQMNHSVLSMNQFSRFIGKNRLVHELDLALESHIFFSSICFFILCIEVNVSKNENTVQILEDSLPLSTTASKSTTSES